VFCKVEEGERRERGLKKKRERLGSSNAPGDDVDGSFGARAVEGCGCLAAHAGGESSLDESRGRELEEDGDDGGGGRRGDVPFCTHRVNRLSARASASHLVPKRDPRDNIEEIKRCPPVRDWKRNAR